VNRCQLLIFVLWFRVIRLAFCTLFDYFLFIALNSVVKFDSFGILYAFLL